MALLIAPTDLHHYEVSGATLDDASSAMGEDEDEAGLCSYELSYGYGAVSRRGYPVRLRLSLLLTIDMPEWKERDAGTGPEQREWDRFYRVLLAHERGHSSRTRAETRRLFRRMRRTRVSDLDDVYQTGLETIDEVNEAYDDATDHGLRPPPGTTIRIP